MKVIKLLWESDGPVDFAGEFYHLEHARLDTELYDGKCAADLDRRGRARGCWGSPAAMPMAGGRRASIRRKITRPSSRPFWMPAKLRGATCRHFVPALTQISIDWRRGREYQEMLEQPMVKSIILMLTAHEPATTSAMSIQWAPIGAASWISIRSSSAARRLSNSATRSTPRRSVTSSRSARRREVAVKFFKGMADAGMRVFKVMDYGGMAGREIRRQIGREGASR